MPGQPTQPYLKLHPLTSAWLINTGLFGIILAFTCPVYLSGDDLNIMQTLAGGYGKDTSICPPFLYGTHYFISVPIRNLYKQFPTVNWYSVWLVMIQYLSGIGVLLVLLSRTSFFIATISYLLLFLVFGSWMLLYLNQSSTSIVATLASLLLIGESVSETKLNKFYGSAGVLLLLIAALIRFHTIVPVIVVAAPFFLLVPGIGNKLKACGSIAITVGICWLLYQNQYSHYTAQCSAWEQEEQYRAAKYANINYHKDQQALQQSPYKTEVAMLRELLLFDTSFPNTATLHTLAQTTNGPMPVKELLSTNTWHWNFVNHRLMIAVLLLALLAVCVQRSQWIVPATSLLIGLAAIVYMQQYRKMPAYFIPAVLFTITACTATMLPVSQSRNKLKPIGLLAIAIALGAWALVRTVKASQQNAEKFSRFQSMYQEMSSRPDRLFINTNNDEAYGYFYCFANPSQYSFKNILFLDHPVQSRSSALQTAFGVADIRKAPVYKNIYFAGPPSQALLLYYQKITGRRVEYSPPLPDFKLLEVRRLFVQQ